LDPERSVRITGTGHAVPEKVLTNDDLSRIVDTSDEWITTRTGIKNRRIAVDGENNSDFAARACERALADAGRSAKEVDYILIGTVTGDRIFPSTACIVQEKIGAHNAAAWDVSAACSGFLYSLSTGLGLLRAGMGKTALVVGSEVLTRLTNWKDRSTCVLFGDGAGAVLLESREGEEGGILSTFNRTDGRLVHLLNAPKGGSADPITQAIIDAGEDKITMNGREVFKHAVRNMGDAARRVIADAGIDPGDVSLFIPHQANTRIIDALATRLEIDRERVYVNIRDFGNTSAASIPIALDQARKAGRINAGDHVLMAAFGGGLTWGAALVRF